MDNYFNIIMTICVIISLAILIPIIMREGFSNYSLSNSIGGYHNSKYNKCR